MQMFLKYIQPGTDEMFIPDFPEISQNMLFSQQNDYN